MMDNKPLYYFFDNKWHVSIDGQLVELPDGYLKFPEVKGERIKNEN